MVYLRAHARILVFHSTFLTIMPKTRVARKFQIIIPKEIREKVKVNQEK